MSQKPKACNHAQCCCGIAFVLRRLRFLNVATDSCVIIAAAAVMSMSCLNCSCQAYRFIRTDYELDPGSAIFPGGNGT